MQRSALLAFASLGLLGCTSNNITVENTSLAAASNPVAVQPAQAGAVGQASQAAPAAGTGTLVRPLLVAQTETIMTSTERMAKAHEIVWNKTTIAGARLLLASPASLAPDCSPLGPVEVKVLNAPAHGVVDVQAGKAFPHYVPGDPPYACNDHLSPATIVTYRASPGFSGEDSTRIQIFFPDGDAPMVLFHIAVE